MNRRIFAAAILLGILQIAHTQPAGAGLDLHIKGKVVDAADNRHMEYVNVALYSSRDSSLVTGTITDEQGFFDLSPRRPGKYYINVDFMGYTMKSVKDIKVNPQSPSYNISEIKLDRSSINVDAVEVTAEKPFVSYEIDRKVIDVSRNPSAQGGSAVDALENVPSVEIDIEGNVALRGNTNFTVLIDGRQSILSGTDALNQIPSDAIENIEIITNPSAKYDPDGTAGIINVITKKGKYQGHSLLVNLSAGNHPMLRGSVNYSMRKKKFTLSSSISMGDGQMQFQHKDYRTTEVYDTPGQLYYSYLDNFRNGGFQHKNLRLNAGIDYYLSEANTFSLSAGYSDFEFARTFESDIYSTPPESVQHNLFTESESSSNPLSYQINLGDKHVFGENDKHFLSVDFMYQSSTSGDESFLDSDTLDLYGNPFPAGSGITDEGQMQSLTSGDENRTRLEINYSQPFSDAFWFEAGYTFRNDNYLKTYTRFDKTDLEENWTQDHTLTDGADYTRNIHAVWASAKGSVWGMQYAAGLRFEHTDRVLKTEKENWNYTYKYPGFYPSFSLAKEWGNGNILQTGYSRRINRPRDHHMNPFPSLSDGYVIFQPNPTLEPEYATSIEVNYQKMRGTDFIAVESFYKYTTNEFDRVNLPSQGDTMVHTIINLDSELDAGIETVANYKPFKWWMLNPSVSVSYREVKDTQNEEVITKSNIDYRLNFNSNFFLSTKTRVQLSARYRSPRNEIDGERAATYYFSGAVRQEFADRKLGLTFRIDDIFGTRKRDQWTYTETAAVHSIGQRKSPMFVLSLQYRFNQQDNPRNGDRGGNTESGGDMDMDF